MKLSGENGLGEGEEKLESPLLVGIVYLSLYNTLQHSYDASVMKYSLQHSKNIDFHSLFYFT